MSIKLMTLAFQAPYKPTPKLVLLALCDFSNDKGVSYPSLNTLKEKCSVGKTNLTYVLRAFETIDLLKRDKRKRVNGSDTSSMYFLQITKLKVLANIDEKYDDVIQNRTERQRFITEYEDAYRKSKGSPSEHLQIHSVNPTQNHSMNTPVHKSEHLEPSINHQEEISKDISSSKKRETFNDFRARIKNEYLDTPLIKGAPGFLKDTVISLSSTGYLHNEISQKDLTGDDAKKVWTYLYSHPNKIIPSHKEENHG